MFVCFVLWQYWYGTLQTNASYYLQTKYTKKVPQGRLMFSAVMGLIFLVYLVFLVYLFFFGVFGLFVFFGFGLRFIEICQTTGGIC